MNEKNRTTVRIYGAEYTLVGTESEEYMQKVCLYVDRLMRSLSADARLPAAKAAVLAAINMSDDYHKAKDALERATEELTHYRKENATGKGELDGLKQENAYLKEEIQRLKLEMARRTGR